MAPEGKHRPLQGDTMLNTDRCAKSSLAFVS
jgi:hypothetical protein